MAAPDADLVKKVLSEINMNEKDLEQAVVTMKQWLTKRPHLPEAAQDDIVLKAFIIGCKSVERAKEKLDKYFTNRLSYKDSFYSCRDPNEIDWIKSAVKFSFLPGYTKEGYKILLIVPQNKEQSPDFSPDEFMKAYFMVMDSYMKDVYMSSGIICVFDMSKLCLEFTLRFPISLASASSKVFLGSFPYRMKGMITFNSPNVTHIFFSTLVLPFISAKLKERIHVFCEDHTKLEKFFPIEMLPSDYSGGKAPSMDSIMEANRKRLKSERDWFLNEGSQTVNEHVRPLDDSDQLKGTFRKLQID